MSEDGGHSDDEGNSSDGDGGHAELLVSLHPSSLLTNPYKDASIYQEIRDDCSHYGFCPPKGSQLSGKEPFWHDVHT